MGTNQVQFGSTCYANSVIQALFHTPVFRNALVNAPYLHDNSPELATDETTGQSRSNILDDICSEPKAQYSYTRFVGPAPPITTKKKKGLNVWSTDDEEKEENRKKAFYPKGELPGPHPMFPEPPANKYDQAFRGQEMKPTDDTATDLFKKKLLEEHLVISPAPRTGGDAVLFHSLRDLYAALIKQRQRTGILSPKSFMETLRNENEMFRQNMHHDAHEFLNYILNSVHEGYSSLTSSELTANVNFVHKIFEGTLASEVRCLTCENITSRDESFLDLSLDIEENTSVSACMRAFSASEFLREKNKFFCEKCSGLQEAERRMKIRKLPQILALHLKRFKFEPQINRHVKLQHVVRYETTLRLGNTTDDAIDPDRLYELYAVVVHLGGASYHGHYIACVRTDHLGWILYDDEHVERIPESVVMRFVGGEDSATACAYVLFYRTVDLEEPLESKASLVLSPNSIHTSHLPPQVSISTPASPVVSTTGSIPNGVPIPVSVKAKDPTALEKAQSYGGHNNSISPPQAACMKRAGLVRSSTNSSLAPPRPNARRMLSNVFANSAHNSNNNSANTSPVSEMVPQKTTSPVSPGPFSSIPSNAPAARSVPRSMTFSNLPNIVTDNADHHHNSYTGTTIISTPLEEHEEPDWYASAPPVIAPRQKPQRPGLGEKKSTGLSRFSSFRGKRGSFFGGKKDEVVDSEQQQQQAPAPFANEKLKRRTSVFGMGSK